MTASAAVAAGYTLAAGPVRADIIKTDTDGLTTGDVKIEVADGEMPGYFARPKDAANPPVVVQEKQSARLSLMNLGRGAVSSIPTDGIKKAASVQNTPRPLDSPRHPARSPTSIYRQRKRSRPKSAESPADLNRLDTPAVPGMDAPPHNVAATLVVVGIVSCVIRIIVVTVVVAGAKESADEESAPMVEATVVETAVVEAVPRKAATLNGCEAAALNSRRTDRARAREAAAKPYTPTAEATSETTMAATETTTTMAATETTTMAASSAAMATTSAAATARQSYVWRQHAD